MSMEPNPSTDRPRKPKPKGPVADQYETQVPLEKTQAGKIGGKLARKELGVTSANNEQTVAPDSPDFSEGPMPAEKKPQPAPPEKSGSTLGDYRLLKKLGQGGMGAVYKAQQISTERIVALKVLAKELAAKESFVLRFKRESRAMTKLDHPNVLGCLDVGEAKGFHFLAMELVEGGSVEGWLKKLGKFTVGDALHVVLKTCEALQHAHEKSIIHRDVKPDNILLTADGTIKVADLGLAKDTDEDVSLTKTGAGAGTPVYMAPEQARDVKRVDARVDIYAVGVMMYVLLTGQPPFKGDTLVELISAKEKGKFDPMRRHNDEVPPKLDLIVDKMISKDPKLRYASCQDVIEELTPLGLAAEHLSFFAPETSMTMPALQDESSDDLPESDEPDEDPTDVVKKQPKSQKRPPAEKTKGPGKIAAKTTGPQKIAAKTTGPQKMASKTVAPKIADVTGTPDDEEEQVEQDVWYWNMVTPEGKIVTKKLTTDQVKALIKAGHLDQKAEVSKTKGGSYRHAATFMEFQGAFKAREAATKANIKGQKYKEQFKDIAAEYDRRKRWGWLSRTFKGVGGTLFGLLWIALILAIVGGAGYWGYLQFVAGR
jgi:eukaryotic-like serine/threonine-protein kinase